MVKYIEFGVVILIMASFISSSIGSVVQHDYTKTSLVENKIISNNNWIEYDKLLPSDGAIGDVFGNSISIDDDYMVIGSQLNDDNGDDSGSAYVYKLDGTNWTQHSKLIPSDGEDGDKFGRSVSIDGDYIIIGAPYGSDNPYDNPGSAYIFKRDGENWYEEAELLASDGLDKDYFGCSVSIDGDYAIVGAWGDSYNGPYSGSAYIFRRDGATWYEAAILRAYDGEKDDRFGDSVSINGDYAIVGASGDDDCGYGSGSAYIFKRDGLSWTLESKILPSQYADYGWFGYCVLIENNTAIVGAYHDYENGDWSGAVYVFERNDTVWTLKNKLFASDEESFMCFGCSISLYEEYLLIGAYRDDYNGYDSGSAYIFKRDGTNWTEEAKLVPSDGTVEDNFGWSLYISGDYIVVGSCRDDDNGEDSGSAYIFRKSNLSFEITGGLGVNIIITNNGDDDILDEDVRISVEVGLIGLFNKEIIETVDIPAGESVKIRTGLILGFGKINILVTIADLKKVETGLQIFIFTIIN